MITIWSGADTPLATRVFAPAIRQFRPDVPANRFIRIHEEKDPPIPAKGEVVLACGNKALDKLKQISLLHKGRTLTAMREKPIPHGDGHFLLTYDPYLTLNEPDKAEIVAWDLRLAHRFLTTGTMEPKVGDYVYVSSYAAMIEEIKAEHAATGKPVKVAFDTETMGLYPWYKDKDFVVLQFTHRPGRSELLYIGPKLRPKPIEPGVIEQIRWLLTSPMVRLRMANGKFDLMWVREKWGIECTNFTFDTLLVGSLLNENRRNTLNLHAKLFTDFGGYDDKFNATYDKGHMEDVPPEPMRVYAGGDTDACYRVADIMQDELCEQPTLKTFYTTILHPAARAFEKIERRGVLVDQEKLAVLRADLQKVVKEGYKRQLELIPFRLRVKEKVKIEALLAAGRDPLLPSMMKAFFFSEAHGCLGLKALEFTPKTGEPTLGKSHLRTVAENAPNAQDFLKVMNETDSAYKTLSTFVDGFLKHLRPDGRFHPSYMLFHGEFGGDGAGGDESGTVTGRLSAKEPAFQTIPKKTYWAKRLRECYPAPKGKVVVSIDYSQGELKVVACFAPENTMIKAYKDGLDLHAVTGAKLALVDIKEFLTWKDSEDKEKLEAYEKYRGSAKPMNFGLLYGMGAEGFQAYAWAIYNLKLTLEEATKMRDAFFELYPGLIDFHTRQKTIVNLHGEVVSPLGRVRHLPTIHANDRSVKSKAERQAINSPIQSTLADMLQWAIALIDAELGEDFQVVGNIHDAMVAYVDENKVQTLIPQVLDIMGNLPFHKLGWQPQLKFTSDAEYGPNLAEMKKFKVK